MATSAALGRALSRFNRSMVFTDLLQLVLVAVAFLLYFVVRANVVDRPDLAIENALKIVDFEQALGIYSELAWQQAILDHEAVVRSFNLVYFWLDFPLIAVLGFLLYFTRRQEYRFTRDALLISGAFALACYALFPVAPPRLLPGSGMVDTLQLLDNASYQAQSTEFFVNPYAAMPSLHVGWAFLVSIGVMRAYPGNRLVLILALLHPIAQWISTVVTGNHYFLDGVGGLVAAAIGLYGAVLMQRRGHPYLKRRLGIEV